MPRKLAHGAIRAVDRWYAAWCYAWLYSYTAVYTRAGNGTRAAGVAHDIEQTNTFSMRARRLVYSIQSRSGRAIAHDKEPPGTSGGFPYRQPKKPRRCGGGGGAPLPNDPDWKGLGKQCRVHGDEVRHARTTKHQLVPVHTKVGMASTQTKCLPHSSTRAPEALPGVTSIETSIIVIGGKSHSFSSSNCESRLMSAPRW